MRSSVSRKFDGIYRSSVTLLANTWKNHPFRIPILLIAFLLSLTVSAGLLVPPQSPVNQKVSTAKASTYQFVPTSGNLVTGTELNANSLLAAAGEGVNTGSWKGTLADDGFHWMVDILAANTPNINLQLDLGAAKVTNANKLLIQTEIDLDKTNHLLKVQICDWVSSTSVDAAADSECTTGGWRTLNSKTAANVDVDISLITGVPFQWHIFDGYFTTGTTGGSPISTPLTNFTSSDTQPIRIRYWSDTDTTCSSNCNLAIDFLRASALVDSIYHPASFTNLTVSGGNPTGTYANAHLIGNTATGQQSVTAGNAVSIDVPGTGSNPADFYFSFKNVQTYTGMNTIYVKADYFCSVSDAAKDHRPKIYNFNSSSWEDLTTASIDCSTTNNTNAWAKNNVTISNYISSGEIRVGWYRLQNSTDTVRIDYIYIMVGSTNTDSAQCEVTWGTGTATNCTNTRDLDVTGSSNLFANTAEDESNTADNDYYANDCDQDANLEECSAANIDFSVTVPADAQVAVNHFAGRFAGDLVGTSNPDLTAQMGIRDYSGTPTSTASRGGWTAVGASSATSAFIYTDSITALAIGTYGNQTNPDDHVDTTNNEMNIRMRTTASGLSSDNSRWDWDFAMVSIGWVVDSSHPTRNYQFAPTGDTLVTGSETARLAQTAAANTGVNTGGWQGTLGDDNLHWTIAGSNEAAATNFDLQLNFTTAKQNGANKLLIQTEFDTDLNIGALVQICDWVSSTSVDTAADAQCTTGGWRTINSQNASNADVAYTGTTAVVLQWHIFDGYFTTGTTGGSAISTPLSNFFHSSNGVKIRFFSTTQTNTNIDIDFLRIQPIIDSVYHPAEYTGVNSPTAAGTYANAHVVGNTASAQQSVTDADDVFLTVTNAVSAAEYYFTYKNIKIYSGMNSIYVKTDYSCSAASPNHTPRIWNFTSGAWEDLAAAAITCSTTEANHGWAKNNITISDYVNGGQMRVGQIASAASANSLRIDLAYVIVGTTNTDTADCQISFGSGTATNCSNTRDLDGTGTANRFDNAAEDESATMGTGDSNAYYAFSNESTPDTTTEESATSNISFSVTQPTNSSIVGEHFAGRFSGCGNTGNACGAAALTVQLGFKDYGGFNQATGGWLQIGGTSGSSTLAYSDTITAMTIGVYGQQINPEDYLDTSNNKVNLHLRTTTPGTNTTNVTTVWDFALVSLQWIEIGTIIDIQGNSSVASQTIAVAVDGLLQVGKTATGAGGGCPCAWTISSVFVGKGRVVLVWHDGASDANESSGITNYDGTGNITGMELTAHTFSVGSGDDQSKTYSELVLFDNDADEDVMYKAVSNAITVDATSTYSDDTLNILSGDTLVVGGSETLTAYNVTIDGTLTSGGATAYTIQGDWINNGTFNESTSTVTMNGTTSEDLDSGCSNTDTCTAENFYNLILNKTDASSSNDNLTLLNFGIRVTNTLTLTDGELIQGTLNVRVEGSSAVSIASAGTWTNISTGDLKLGGTFVNDGAVTFNSNNGTQCVDAADDIAISSTSGGSVRTWSGSGTETIYNVAATDMADSSVTAYTSGFTNTTWTAGVCTITISGGCFTDETEGVACTEDIGNSIRVAVNGSLSAALDNVVDGSWTLSNVTQPAANDILVIFINGEATNTEEATTVIKYDGSGDVTNVRLYQSQLVIGADSGSSNSDQTVTVADMDTTGNGYENSDDEDVLYDVTAGADLTVDAESNKSEQLYIISGDTYRPASGGGSDTTTYNLEVDTGAIITADSNALTASNDLTVDGTLSGTGNVTVNAEVTGAGTVNLSGGTFTQRILGNSNYGFGSNSGTNNWTFNNLTIHNSDTNNHTITTRSGGTGEIDISGDLTLGSVSDSNSLTLDNNTNDRILDVEGSVVITSQGVLQASNSASFTVGNDWTNNNTFTHNNGTVTFDTTATATFAGATTFYGLTSTTAAKTLEFTAGQTFTIDTGGLLTLTGTADPNEIQIKSTTSSQWFINHQGTESVSYVQVINSGCDGASTQISTSDSVNDGNNGACWLFGSTFEQADYRFGEEPGDSSTDSDYTGAPTENTAYSTTGTGDIFRLRMLLHVGGSNLAQNGETFKLQFGEKTAATCTSGVSWSDVSPSSGVIRYYNGTPADGDNISSVAGDPDHSGHTKQYQDYEESNNFTNSVAGINAGQDGVWAFSLQNHSAVGGKRYCFKVLKSTGSDLDVYTFYPEVIIDEELIFSLDSTSKDFGVVTPGGNPTNVSSTLTTTTNSSTGYVIYTWATQVMTKGSDTLTDWIGTNSLPITFGNGSFGFGYTTDDSDLTGGTADRFTNGGAKYAGFPHTGPGDPVADRTSGPISGATDTITYRLAASTTQAAGTYNTVIVYVCSVTF